MSAAETSAATAAPDLITAVIGFRQWRLRDGVLWSTFAGAPWPGGQARATCLAAELGDDSWRSACAAPPAKRCRCGIYAWYRPCPTLASTAPAPELVAGAVALWGRIELHGNGMRAEHASVVALALPLSRGAKRRHIQDLATDLGIDAVPTRHLAAAALRYGGTVPDTLKISPADHG